MTEQVSSILEELKYSLTHNRSKTQMQAIAAACVQNPALLNGLMSIYLNNTEKIAEYAGWAVGILSRDRADLLAPWYKDLVDLLYKTEVPKALKRNALVVFQQIEVPEELMDTCFDACYSLFADPFQEVAVRVFAMSVLAGICEKVPELWPEIRIIIEDNMPHAQPAFKSRGRKILAAFEKP